MTDFTHKTLAIIPARAGSKRLPGKNTLPLAGKPLIQWSIDLARTSKEINLVAVTSDDPDVLQLAASSDCIVIRRPAELASDTASTFDVIRHTLDELKKQGITPEQTLLLQPTSPLRNREDIEAGFRLMAEKQASSIISVCPAEHSPLWCNTLDDNLSMAEFLPDTVLNQRSQDLPQHYRLNGAFYLAKTPLLLKHQSFLIPNSFALVMKQERSIDIDTELDFLFCQTLIQHQRTLQKE